MKKLCHKPFELTGMKHKFLHIKKPGKPGILGEIILQFILVNQLIHRFVNNISGERFSNKIIHIFPECSFSV